MSQIGYFLATVAVTIAITFWGGAAQHRARVFVCGRG